MRAPAVMFGALVMIAAACAREASDRKPAPSPPPTPAASQPSGATAPAAEAADTAAFLRLESGWAEALAAKDRATLEYLLAPEFLITGIGSTAADPVGDRAQWLDRVGAHPWPKHEVLDVRVAQASPDVAVVKCIWRGDYPPDSITDAGGSVTLLQTDVWARRNGRWQVIARHTSLPRAD